MKKIITFSRYFLPAAIFSLVLAVIGIIGLFHEDQGINLGIDFQPGLLQEIQFIPSAFQLSYQGPGNLSVSVSLSQMDVIITGTMAGEQSLRLNFSDYPTLGGLIAELRAIENLTVSNAAPLNTSFIRLVQSAENPLLIHYLPVNTVPINIADVRSSLLALGNVSVQELGNPLERHFMIRMEDDGSGSGGRGDEVSATLERDFGTGELVVTHSAFVEARFARQLGEQAVFIIAGTLLLILAYCTFRFKLQYALGAIIALIHNGLITITFIVWSGMEFNTITIAALLTVLGYSINDIIVVYDRLKETRRIFPDAAFTEALNRAITETLSRTIITTLTTMIAVGSLFAFTTGSMRDFSAALLVGMATGVYATIFIAMGFVNFWENRNQKLAKKKLGLSPLKV